ncbi:MAG: DUF1674 domain-containing protein [Pseudomonadota bacterium]
MSDTKEERLAQAAARALEEAEARKTQEKAKAKKRAAMPKELGGRDGPEPTRFGDWELKGITSDF